MDGEEEGKEGRGLVLMFLVLKGERGGRRGGKGEGRGFQGGT